MQNKTISVNLKSHNRSRKCNTHGLKINRLIKLVDRSFAHVFGSLGTVGNDEPSIAFLIIECPYFPYLIGELAHIF